MSKHLIVKHLATLGPCTALGDVTEVRILIRIVRWVKPPYGSGRERIEYEADPRHAELIIHQFGLSSLSRSVSMPSEKSKPGVDLSSLLNSADHTLYRSATLSVCYLALDRLDLQFPSKELARWMQAPAVGHQEALKRVARHLTGHGRLVQEFVRQVEEPFHVVVFTDSDRAGCLETRKSTSSHKHFFGSHTLRSTSTAQRVIALSSGESEFYVLVKGTSAGLGAVSLLKDLGVDTSENTKIDKAVLEVRVDASAGQSMAVRRGAGWFRHIASKSRTSLESRTRQISEPNTLTEDQSDEHWRGLIATFVKEGLESHCEQRCKRSRNPILKFSLFTMHVKLTLSRKRKWSRNSIDHESSDAVKLTQLRDEMVNPP